MFNVERSTLNIEHRINWIPAFAGMTILGNFEAIRQG